MWATEHTDEGTVEPDEIWRIWPDVEGWPEWNADLTVRTIHRAEPLDDGRVRVTYRMEITGPAADSVGPEIGPQISGDFSEVLAALVGRARE